ncbi:hypothetical protein SAMN05216353_15820 [Halobacillus alkaliphilus]|uniref:Uncharacterized protein n=1 Tax=Halobacillus alkaliphilus TaxID=396056 RepID=A0A1I2T0Q6_9BACI|nr:hypothetical protein [Halobacillus alkaliphilus]SFG57729.1 hypothetical protein SAMN05216353_15820 [Halobacillus alkaliphilus]
MIHVVITTVVIGALVGSVIFTVRKRKKLGYTDLKSALTPICFYLIAVTQLAAYWFDLLGLISWGVTMGLLLLGAYFTKYSIQTEKKI